MFWNFSGKFIRFGQVVEASRALSLKTALALTVMDPFQRRKLASAEGIPPKSAWKGGLRIWKP